ncbi:DNA-processing protein DprA [Actinomadura syzygii]|uniref:DNA-processing protein DprA n=1 Tax=Actinomadura syzygii TaxID=1427538 RepID=A0A5D0TS48_9ACTN|nr:DNA-processing protein DprA [Actinomadura syzygii]TYC08594.1 DNA-processing protein DprA [Actinomadura syzygii]
MSVTTSQQRDLLTLCALRVDGKLLDWNMLARACQTPDALATVMAGELTEDSRAASRGRVILRQGLRDLEDARAYVDAELAAAEKSGARLITVLDEDYPANLRLVPNLPPFLFYRGELEAADARSVAVVGTRAASEIGQSRAARMARELVAEDVVVFSGLAAGIDTAAHTGTLQAGGRTVAVMGTGIAARVFPAQNRGLAEQILEQDGALVSQFWPTAPSARWTFPQRNVVMSGATMGTIVIEASSTSGAKMQARIAAEHGKQVFLIRSLATQEPWAADMIASGQAVEVAELADVLGRLGSAQRVHQASQQRLQLALGGL